MQHFDRETYLMKLMLVLMRDRRARQGQVRSVGYLREYGELPYELGVLSLGQFSNEELLSLADSIGVKKRPANGRSDIYMNDLGYILLSTNQSLAVVDNISLQNLTSLAEQLGLTLAESISNLYSELTAEEDQAFENVSLFESNREQWIKLISYILCNSSNPSACLFPADYVLYYTDPLNMNSWDIYEPEVFINKMWGSLRIKLCGEDCISVIINKTTA